LRFAFIVWLLPGMVACSRPAPAPAPAAPASNSTAWWHNGVCYEVFVRSFQDSDGDGIGDLRGLTARLDYINDGNPHSKTSLGANCIWLMPIAEAMSYHGYDVVDYYRVDPHYGNGYDFRRLVEEAHKRGIHVIVDFVPNHTGSQNPWFQAALRDTSSSYRDWYRWSKTLPMQKGPWGQEAWHKSPRRDEYYYGVFWHEMPDLNYDNSAVRAEMQKVLRYWIDEMHADGFRFDAISYLVEDDSAMEHSRGTHDVLREMGNTVRDADPRSFTVGEMTDESPGVMETYYPDQLDSYFAFAVAKGAMHAAETGNAREFVGAVAHANENFPAERWSPFLTNHDQPRVMTVLGDEPKARVAASAVLMLPGMPFIYYGEEIGMVGDKPDERIRTPMQWSAGANGGFTSGTPWEELQADWRTKNVAGQDSSSASLLNHYRRLIQMRNAEPALNRGKLRLLDTTHPSIVAWLRYLADERFMIVVNFGSLDSEVDVAHAPLPRGDYRLEPVYADPVDACAGYTYLNESGSLLVKKVKAHGFCALRIRSP
jgi:alpha-amylase